MKNRINIMLIKPAFRGWLLRTVVTVVLLLGSGSTGVIAAVDANFLYALSNFSGPVPYNWGRVFVDRERNEIYVLYKNAIRVFSQSGMEIYRFGEDSDLGRIVDAAVDLVGNILLLTDKGAGVELLRCNFRREPVAKFKIKNLPAEFSPFSPNRIICREGRFYFAALDAMKVVVAATDGEFEKGYDIAPLLDLTKKEKASAEIVVYHLRPLVTSLDLYPKGSNVSFTCERGWRGLCVSTRRDRRNCQVQALVRQPPT